MCFKIWRIRTLVLLVERTVAAPAAEGVGLCVPLTKRKKQLSCQRKSTQGIAKDRYAPEGCGTYVPLNDQTKHQFRKMHGLERANRPFVYKENR